MGGFSFKKPAFPTSDFGGDCTFSLVTTLVSPQISALDKVRVGDKLQVRLSTFSKALEVLNNAGEICGLVVPQISRYISCIKKGILFEAIVVALDGSACHVLVQNSK